MIGLTDSSASPGTSGFSLDFSLYFLQVSNSRDERDFGLRTKTETREISRPV